MHITSAGRTDVGIIRSGNEDSYLMVPDRGIFIVADGMGGHAAGEVASEMAVRFVARELDSLRGMNDHQVAERMRTAIRTANGAIFQRTLTEHDKRGMGTTVTSLALYETRFPSAKSATAGRTCCATDASTRSRRTTRTYKSRSTRAT